MFRKNKLAMLVSEFLGTGILTLTVLSISHSQLSLAYFVAVAAGLTVLLMTLALAGISGAIFNPAMTVGLWTVRKIKSVQALTYLVVQLAGGAIAWLVFAYFTKLTGVHNSGHFTGRVLVAETLGTFIFAFCWAAAIYQRFGLYAKAAAIGGGLTLGAFVASLGSAALLNPAVALGAKSWGWGTYVLGPILGAIIGFNLYNLLFVETEIAELAESKAEKSKTGTVNSTLTFSEVARDVDADVKNLNSKAKTTAVKRTVAKSKAAPKKAAKPAVKKPAAKKRNPNAV